MLSSPTIPFYARVLFAGVEITSESKMEKLTFIFLLRCVHFEVQEATEFFETQYNGLKEKVWHAEDSLEDEKPFHNPIWKLSRALRVNARLIPVIKKAEVRP